MSNELDDHLLEQIGHSGEEIDRLVGATDWPYGEEPPICESCGHEIAREEADLCPSCGCWFHPDCLSDHEEECRQ